MINHKSLFNLQLAIIAIVFPISSALAKPELFNYLPSNCEMVAIAPSLTTLNREVQFFANRLDIKMQESVSDTIAKTFATDLGLEQMLDLDTEKPICLAFTNILAANNSLVVLLPVVDSAQVMSKITGQKLANGSIKRSNEMFIAAKGNYLILANNEFNLSMILSSQSPYVVSDLILDDIKSSELTVCVKISNLINAIRPLLPAVLMNMPDYKDNSEIIESFQNIFSTFAEIDSFSMALDHSEKGFAFKQSMYFRPEGSLATVIKQMDRVALSSFEKLPSGNLISLSAMNISPELIKSAYSFFVDFIAIGSISSGSDDTIKPIRELITIVDSVVETHGDKIGKLVSADYYSDIKMQRLEEQIYSITDSSLEINMVKSLWKDISELSGFSMYKVNSCILDAGEIDGCNYSNMNITINQSFNDTVISSYDLDIFMGKCSSGLIAQAMDKEIFQEALALAKKSETLKDHQMLISASEHLPPLANFYLIADINTYVDIMLANYNQQAPLMAQTNPEIAIPLAAVGPVMNMFGQLEGTAGCSVEIDNKNIRIISFCDTKAVDSLILTAKTIKEAYLQPEITNSSTKETEF